MRWQTISGVIALFPVMIGADCLIKSWPDIVYAYDNIKEVYPAVIALLWLLVLLVIIGIGLLWYTWWLLQEGRRAERVALTAAERSKIKEQFDNETVSFMKELESRKNTLDVQERKLTDDVNLKLTVAAAKSRECDALLTANQDRADTLKYQLGRVMCALEAISEDYETIVKMHTYLGQWLTKAASSPTDFMACVTNGEFDSKRFERCSGKLEKIRARCGEIQEALQEINTQHNAES